MSRSAQLVRLDFIAPVERAPRAGAALLLVGLSAALAVGLEFHRALAERSRLDAAMGSREPPHHLAPTPEARQRAADAAALQRELGLPWTRLLAELESASQDRSGSVALLGVEPDPDKRLVRITAEVRALPDALAYLSRLQKCSVLRHPMLESHERRKDDPEHPLVIKLSAEWRT